MILAAIGRLDRVVACTKYCADVCPEVRRDGRTIIADSWTAQSQQILAARPDLVIAAVPYQEKAVVEILKAGVRFLGLAPNLRRWRILTPTSRLSAERWGLVSERSL